jgi:hypothetical protein
MIESLQKHAAVFAGQSKVNRLIIANISEMAEMQGLLEQFVSSPSPELAQQISEHFNKIGNSFQAVGNAITTLVSTVVDEEPPDEIDVVFDENGARLQ